MNLDVTQVLNRIEDGDAAAAKELFPMVYDELRGLAAAQMAQESPDHTLQATSLVHEVYVRLVGQAPSVSWESRVQFYSAAATAMQRILVDSARARRAKKRGGDRKRIPLSDIPGPSNEHLPDLLIDLDDSLAELEKEDSEAAELVKLKVFAGLSVEEAGRILGMSRSTAYEIWSYARSWMAVRFAEHSDQTTA